MKTKKSNPIVLVLEIIMSILLLTPIALFAIYLVREDPTEPVEKVKNASFLMFVCIIFLVNTLLLINNGWSRIPRDAIMIAVFLILGITGLFLEKGTVLVILICILGILTSFINLITPIVTKVMVQWDIGIIEDEKERGVGKLENNKEEETACTWKIIYGEEEEL